METKEEDWVEHLFLARTHDYLMFFTREGQCYWLKVHEVPLGSRNSRGKPIVNLVNMDPDERIAAVVPVREFSAERSLLFATRNGVVKKTVLSAYGNVRAVGINAINILDGDELIGVQLCKTGDDVVLATREGMAIRFSESDVREMGRATTGVRGISLKGDPNGDPDAPAGEHEVARARGDGDGVASGDAVVGMSVVRRGEEITLLVVTERGMGKRTEVDEYRCQRRGGKGLINLRLTEKTGRVVSMMEVAPSDELMVITRGGVVNRQRVDGIRVIGRNTQGVQIMRLDRRDLVVDIARVVGEDQVEDAVQQAESQPDAEPEEVI